MPCLAVPEIHDFVTGTLDAEELSRIDEHLDRCESCREIVASAGTALGTASPDPSASARMLLPAGTTLDRFAIEGVLGRGAMGVVYAAKDPRLDRRIALKLLRADRQGTDSEELMLEAKSMARLNHPNVVAVYDVGPVAEGEDELYVAMELVEGTSLADWLALRERSWREILRLMIAAGQGLAAAHRAEVCHRDFKPDNVIIGEDGRARVTDFGLARGKGTGGEGKGPLNLEETLSSLTGTPAYMAPELFEGQRASARSDQFSYCVTLFEALCGRRPFDGEGLEELIANVRKGQLQWPRATQAPRKIQRIVERGLSPDPDARFESMADLLQALKSESQSRRRIVGVALASAAAAGIVASLAVSSLSSAASAPCADTDAKLRASWGESQRQAARATLTAISPGLADKTIVALDRFGTSWSAMRQESCEATHLRHDQSDALFDLRTRCLDRKLSEMQALQEQLLSADSKALINAPLWVDGLEDLHACADVDLLQARLALPQDPAARQEIAAIEGELDRALAMINAAEEGGAALAEQLTERARTLGYAPLLSECLQVLSSSLIDAGRFEDADEALQEALMLASGAMDHHQVADLSTSRIVLVGLRQQKFEAALAFTSAAKAAVAQAGSDPVQVAALHMNTGAVYDLAGKREEAEAELLLALEAYKSLRGGRSRRVADVLHNLGALAMERGERELSRQRFEEALAIRESLFGEGHPSVAQTSLGLGALARREGDLEAARTHYQRAETIYLSLYGPDHADLGAVHNNLAIVFMSEENFEAAEEQHRRAMAIRRAKYGAEHPLVAQSLTGLGNALVGQKRYEDAITLHSESVALRRKAYPAEHPSIGIGLHGLAGALSGLARHQEASEVRAEAMRIFLALDADAADVAGMRFDQAKDLMMLESSKARRQALQLANQAREGFAGAGESSAKDLARVEAWLGEQR